MIKLSPGHWYGWKLHFLLFEELGQKSTKPNDHESTEVNYFYFLAPFTMSALVKRMHNILTWSNGLYASIRLNDLFLRGQSVDRIAFAPAPIGGKHPEARVDARGLNNSVEMPANWMRQFVRWSSLRYLITVPSVRRYLAHFAENAVNNASMRTSYYVLGNAHTISESKWLWLVKVLLGWQLVWILLLNAKKKNVKRLNYLLIYKSDVWPVRSAVAAFYRLCGCTDRACNDYVLRIILSFAVSVVYAYFFLGHVRSLVPNACIMTTSTRDWGTTIRHTNDLRSVTKRLMLAHCSHTGNRIQRQWRIHSEWTVHTKKHRHDASQTWNNVH